MRRPAIVAAILLAAAACSSGGDDNDAAAPEAAPAGQCPEGAGIEGEFDDRGSQTAPDSSLKVEAGDFFFDPTCATEVAPGTLTLEVANTGAVIHNVSIPGKAIDMDVAAGETITVEIDVGDEPVPYLCKYHLVNGMQGSLLPSVS